MQTKRIAMWSGPRNLSTAMMYAFAQRRDCVVIDEPFYGAYLHITGLPHPMRQAVLATMPLEPNAIARGLIDAAPAPLYYQKHMCQHMIPAVPREWMADVINVFLIRHPARVIASFAKEIPELTKDDIGFEVQAELFEMSREMGQRPIILDSADVRADPEAMLMKLCSVLEIPYDPVMLSWPTGGNAADGVWSPVWYKSVHQSTGFAGPEGAVPKLDSNQAALAEAALPHYQKLKTFALTL